MSILAALSLRSISHICHTRLACRDSAPWGPGAAAAIGAMPAMAGASAENNAAAGAAAGAPMGTPSAICLVRISVALRTVVFTKKSGPGAGAYTAAGMLVEAANNMTLEGASLVKVLWFEDWFPGLAWPQDCKHDIFLYDVDADQSGLAQKGLS